MSNQCKIYSMMKEVFYALGLSLVIFIIMEIIKPRIVLGYINLTIWFVLWFISGIIILIINKQK